MRKLFFLVATCVLLFFSCRKIYTEEKTTTPSEVRIAEVKVRHFLENELAKAKGASKEKLADVISKN